jgi:hypothetical protein
MGSIPQQLLRYDAVYKCFTAVVHTPQPHWLYDYDFNDSAAAIKGHNPRIIMDVDIELPASHIQVSSH